MALPSRQGKRKERRSNRLAHRSDGIIDLCEMKYSKKEYVITKDYEDELIQKKATFAEVTKTKSAIHTVMITTDGLMRNAYIGEIQNEVVSDDLFL